ncbi:hypothetical protein HG530_011800 [Fusarium avenaceum]|nr:hypothetical protein HG530_011800 [Fusarium avenaceum]
MGYDISNYHDIHRPYGTMYDVDLLIRELKQRGMKLIMDLVVNHTSDQYDSEGKPQPPNNWCSLFDETESAWTYDAKSDEYYLSLFGSFRPDLNWENMVAGEEMYEILGFWPDRGVSGFRMDVISLISKHQKFPDADVRHPDRQYQPGEKYFANGARLMDYLQEMKREVLSKFDTITVGEMPHLDGEQERLEMVVAEDGVLNMIFTFDMTGLDVVPGKGRFSVKG